MRKSSTYKLKQEVNTFVLKLEEETSTLEPKPLVCDRIIFSIASIIFALSFSGFVADFLKSNEYSLACFSPLENRAQYTYINSYCHRHLPVVEYFPVALLAHATVLIIPYYFWKVIFSARFELFFSHAAKLETIGEEGNTEKFPLKNYTIVKYLQKEFDSSKKRKILISYIVKAISQITLLVASLVVNITVFRDVNKTITFECHDDVESNTLFGNVTCAYPKKLYINVLQVIDYLLLVAAMIVLGIGLCRCLLYHPTEKRIAQFSYESSIDAKYLIYCKPSTGLLSLCQMKNDLMFLLAWLSETNSGLSRTFKFILIENLIYQKFDASMKLLNNFEEGRCLGRY